MDRWKKTKGAGFTLGELLIVIAVEAVLVGIAIPVFNGKLEKTRETYDIHTMRQAASLAVELYYAGIKDPESAKEAGFSWSADGNAENCNAYGAYDPRSGKYYPTRQSLPEDVKTYGKGTKTNGGTEFVMGNPSGAYAPDQDYTEAVVMAAIYPNAHPARVDVYWKNNTKRSNYVGGDNPKNVPKYSIRIILG